MPYMASVAFAAPTFYKMHRFVLASPHKVLALLLKIINIIHASVTQPNKAISRTALKPNAFVLMQFLRCSTFHHYCQIAQISPARHPVKALFQWPV